MSEHVFDEVYSSVYDALYQDKDYEAECDFLEQIFGHCALSSIQPQLHACCYTQFSAHYAQSPICTVLDLGCGTGGHVLPLAKRGYAVTGVDRSESMISEAHRKAMAPGAWPCGFMQGDVRTLDLGRTFDVVIAMFAVISYQTTNEDLASTFRTARRHLEPGGLFVFDCWYGPAVLTQKPTCRYKVVERGSERIVRYTSPILDMLRHTVQVNYKVVRLKDDRVLDEADESHLMRFLFPREIEYYLSETGFEMLRLCPFMEFEQAVTEHDWNITVVSRAI